MQILQKERRKSDYRSVLVVAHYQMTVDITKALKGIKVSVIKSEGNNNPNAEDRLFFFAPQFLPISRLPLLDGKWTLDSFLMLKLSRGGGRM